MARLKLSGVTRTFSGVDAVADVSLDVADGEFLAVLGPSGCGKTTLLRLIAGFERPDAGEIAIGGAVVSGAGVMISPEKRRVGLVFQNYALWPHMTVAQNVGYALKVAKVAREEAARRVADALALVDLAGFGERYPASLSGGQRQRVALARCLVAAPSLVLFDEPLANLDVHLRAAMEEEFAAFHRRTGTTMVYITHDQAEAMALADRIAVMDGGRLVQVADPRTLYREPATAMVASFISQGMVLPVTVSGAEEAGLCRVEALGQEALVRCRPGEVARKTGLICCRAADIGPAAAGGPGIDGTVRRAVYKGGATRVEVAPLADPSLVLRFDANEAASFEPGAPVRVRIRSGWLIPAA
ncbi:MAG: ABC transporter ATP-binding protein [Aquamicrobium sp.]|uniref:ABC transporter ATP-binding protein n=1 Tax=Aquamicrobium sp. TaxID=1872579 RepID=UPI00349EFE5F|nr:ABC transporter ATP-binding protein [Aquamicrobium sp.]